MLESNDGGDRYDDDYFRMIISGVIDNASYAGDNDKAYKIVHLGEVFWSREFKCAGKLHNLTNVDTSILRRGIDSYYLVKYCPETVIHLLQISAFFLFSNIRKGRLLYIRPVGRSVGWSVG